MRSVCVVRSGIKALPAVLGNVRTGMSKFVSVSHTFMKNDVSLAVYKCRQENVILASNVWREVFFVASRSTIV